MESPEHGQQKGIKNDKREISSPYFSRSVIYYDWSVFKSPAYLSSVLVVSNSELLGLLAVPFA